MTRLLHVTEPQILDALFNQEHVGVVLAVTVPRDEVLHVRAVRHPRNCESLGQS